MTNEEIMEDSLRLAKELGQALRKAQDEFWELKKKESSEEKSWEPTRLSKIEASLKIERKSVVGIIEHLTQISDDSDKPYVPLNERYGDQGGKQ